MPYRDNLISGRWPMKSSPPLLGSLGKLSVVAALVIYSGITSAAAAPEPADFRAVATQCAPGVHISTLSAVVTHESAGNPYAIGINADGVRLPRQPRSKAEAVKAAQQLLADGYSFDSGLGQINSKNLEWLGMSVADLFDPCKNLAGAATVLTECYKRGSKHVADEQAALRAALSCYNTGNLTDGLSNGYVQRVVAAANLDVPALLPVETDSAPVRLQAHKATKQPQDNARKPLPNGIGDAFSKSSDDVFTVFDREQAESADAEKGDAQ